MRRFSWHIVWMTAVAPFGGGAAAAQESVRIDCQVFRIEGNLSGETELSEDIQSRGDAFLTYFNRGDFKLEEDTLHVDENAWTWKGRPLEFNSASQASPADEKFSLIAPASVTVISGGSAVLQVNSTQKIEYLEKREDGLFELKTLPESTGLEVRMVVEKDGEDKVRLRDMDISMRLIDSREPIPGVSLQVGRPNLKTQKYRAQLRLTSGKNYGILLHSGSGKGLLLIRLKVELTQKTTSQDEHIKQ